MKSRQLFPILFLLVLGPSVFGYALEGPKWTLNRKLHLHYSLDSVMLPTGANQSFDRGASGEVTQWGVFPQYHLDWTELYSADGFLLPVAAAGDDEISITFSHTIFGDAFGTNVLAVTVYEFDGPVMTEGDILLNLARRWDIPDGIPPPDLDPFGATIEHEFGHLIGLDHPDEHGQVVAAIMNSHLGDYLVLQSDDYAGIQALYLAGPPRLQPMNGPVLINLSTRGLVGTGDDVLIAGFIVQGSEPATVVVRGIGQSLIISGVNNPLFNPKVTVYNSTGVVVGVNDDWIDGFDAETIASYGLDPENSRAAAVYLTLDPGAYTAVLEGVAIDGHPATGIGLIEMYDLHKTSGRAGNISTRGPVQSGDEVIIGGFIVGGDRGKDVIVRALGPSLTSHGVASALADPLLELHDTYGDLISVNDDWGDGPDAALIEADGLAPADPKEAALRVTVYPSQSTTAIVKSASSASGIGLVEIYDLALVTSAAAQKK